MTDSRDSLIAGATADVSLSATLPSPWHGRAVVLIIIIAGMLRFAALDQYPLPIHQDELSDSYDGYSLATTGADRSGDRWPIIVRGMGPGDYHPGLYVYLAAITTGLTGFSVWSGRLPAAVAGMLTVLLVYAVARRTLGWRGALLALAFMSFSPVHILYSRQAHTGGCLPPLFVILSVYLFLRLLNASNDERTRQATWWWSIAAGLVVGLFTSAYGAARLSALLLAMLGVGLIVLQFGLRQREWRRAAVAVGLFTLAVTGGALPQLYSMIAQPEDYFVRASNVLLPFGNGLRWWIEKFVIHLGLNLDPRHLFFSMGEYRDLCVARLGIVSLPFLYLGMLVVLVRVFQRRSLSVILLLGAMVIALMPALVSRPNPHPMRASGVWALYPIIAAAGAQAIGVWLLGVWGRLRDAGSEMCSFEVSHRKRMAGQAATVLVIIIAATGLWNVSRYLAHPEWHGIGAQHHLVEIGRWLRDNAAEYDRVYVDAPGLFPYLYIVAFSGMPPEEYQHTPRESHLTAFGWEKVHRLGRFYFADSDAARQAWQDSDQSESWLLVTGDSDPHEFLPQRQARR